MRKTNIGLGLVGASALLALSSGAANAQALRPNILVIFDTSGSMLYNNNDDGSPLCGTTTNGGTSRIFALKKALREAMAQVGTDEANFGLMRYPELEDPTQTPTCPQGHYNNDNTTGLILPTPTTMTPFPEPVTCGTNNCNQGGCECGCRMASQDSGQTTYGSWFDTNVGQVMLVPVTKPASGFKPTLSTDYDPTDGNISAVYRWIDQTESSSTTGPIADPELRTHSNWYTPLGRSMFYARMYFENYVGAKDTNNKFLDPKAACRQNVVIFVTDGAETCDTQKSGTAKLDLTTCTVTAGTYGTFHPEVQACKLFRSSLFPKGIPTYILTDNGLNATDKAIANAIATAGGTGPTALYATLNNSASVKTQLINIIAKTVPPPETCNGLDENCNGLIDEGVSNKCVVSNLAADNALGVNAVHCKAEICNNCIDDNCDGQIDEGCGETMNACGRPTMCPQPPEICNGVDDDCDGTIDNGITLVQGGTTLHLGDKCANPCPGIVSCNGVSAFCDMPRTASTEVCNGIDDNCNGAVDEGTLPGTGVTCGANLGTCHAGTTACVAGKLVCSSGTGTPTAEVCDGLDNNCDGVVDNGNFPQTGTSCICPGLDPLKDGVGTCKAGHLICRGTRGFVCEGCVLPGPEICDGLDNDCDGVADMNPICPSGLACKEGRCAILCLPGEFPCPNGYKCVGDYCVPQRCANKTCPTDQRCDENTGACVDVCAGVVCRDPKICQHGACVDCYTLGCAAGQLCNAGSCQVDKCAGVTCAGNQYCADGACVDLCTKNKCSSGERCVGGSCIADTCATVGCGGGQFCDQKTGVCRIDTCAVTQCPRGQRCIQETGACAADPCNLINCPGPCWQCAVTSDGKASCQVSGDCKEVSSQIGIKGGGDGCGCAVGAGDPSDRSGLVLFAAVLGLCGTLSSRRRRGRG